MTSMTVDFEQIYVFEILAGYILELNLKKLRYKYFPVNFAKYSKADFLLKNPGRLLYNILN